MELNFTQSQTLKQSQQLSVRQLQGLKILEMNNYELDRYIENELMENPFLEREEAGSREEYGSAYEHLYGRSQNQAETFEIPDEKQNILKEHLLSQLNRSGFTKAEWQLLSYLMESFDSMGFIRWEAADIAEIFGVDVDAAKKCLAAIRSLEPAGIGASGLEDCLIIQLERAGYTDEKLHAVVRNHLLDVSFGHLNKIAQTLGTTTEQVKEYVRIIKTMNPRPSNGYSLTESQYVVPDIMFRKENGEWVIVLNGSGESRLMVSDTYQKYLENSQDSAVAAYCKENVERASWVVNCIEQRRKTVFGIASFILNYQKDFFEGKGPLRQLTMKRAAEALAIHESTVSRAIKDKYVQCPAGTFLFKSFFPGGVASEDGSNSSTDAVKSKIREVIKEEPSGKPYSDNKIAQMLTEKGYQISRRTVAKYREEMGIASTLQRKVN